MDQLGDGFIYGLVLLPAVPEGRQPSQPGSGDTPILVNNLHGKQDKNAVDIV